jgi:hypothetical protein
MMFAAVLAAAIAAGSPASQSQALTCLNTAADRMAADPKRAAELRRWTHWEATRLLWSMAGDSSECADLFKTVHVSVETSNAAYRHADKLVVSGHLYRD